MRGIRRTLLVISGTIALLLGLVGVFLPVLPTTPFLLLSAWCYARSSPPFYKWLLGQPLLGNYIRNYVEGRGVPWRSKVSALTLLWTSIAWASFYKVERLSMRLVILVIATLVTWHVVSLKTFSQKTTEGVRGGSDVWEK